MPITTARDRATAITRDRDRDRATARYRDRARDRASERARARAIDRATARDRARARARSRSLRDERTAVTGSQLNIGTHRLTGQGQAGNWYY